MQLFLNILVFNVLVWLLKGEKGKNEAEEKGIVP